MAKPAGFENGIWQCVDTAERDAIHEDDGLITGQLARIIGTTEFYTCTDAAAQTWTQTLAPGAGTVPADGVDSSNIVDGSVAIADLNTDTQLTAATSSTAGTRGTAPAPPAGSMGLVLRGDNTYGPPADDWAATTYYADNQHVVYAGVLYRAKAAFTSGSSFLASNWDNLSAGSTTPVSDHQLLSNRDHADAHEHLLSRDGSRVMQADLDMGSNKITAVADPEDPTDVVNLQHLETYLGSDFLHVHVSADESITRDGQVPFDATTKVEGGGGLIAVADHEYTLQPGKYRITSGIAGDIDDGFEFDGIGEAFAVVDTADGSVIGLQPNLRIPAKDGFGGASLSAIVEVTSSKTIAVTSRSSAVTSIYAGSWLCIETLGVGGGAAGPDGYPEVVTNTTDDVTAEVTVLADTYGHIRLDCMITQGTGAKTSAYEILIACSATEVIAAVSELSPSTTGITTYPSITATLDSGDIKLRFGGTGVGDATTIKTRIREAMAR